MRLSSLFVLMLISISTFAQIEDWKGADIRLGYRISTTKVTPMLMRIEGDKITYLNGKFSFGSTHLSGVSYTRNVYMDFDFSLAGNLIQSELLNKRNEVVTPDGKPIYYNTSEERGNITAASYQHMGFKLAFGGYINDRIGIFAGGQWKWTSIETATSEMTEGYIRDNPYLAKPSGSTSGFNLNVMAALPWVFVKAGTEYSYVRSWTDHSDDIIHSEGNNVFFDLDAQVNPFYESGKIDWLRVFVKYYYSYTFMRSGYQENNLNFKPGAESSEWGFVMGLGFKM